MKKKCTSCPQHLERIAEMNLEMAKFKALMAEWGGSLLQMQGTLGSLEAEAEGWKQERVALRASLLEKEDARNQLQGALSKVNAVLSKPQQQDARLIAMLEERVRALEQRENVKSQELLAENQRLTTLVEKLEAQVKDLDKQVIMLVKAKHATSQQAQHPTPQHTQPSTPKHTQHSKSVATKATEAPTSPMTSDDPVKLVAEVFIANAESLGHALQAKELGARITCGTSTQMSRVITVQGERCSWNQNFGFNLFQRTLQGTGGLETAKSVKVEILQRNPGATDAVIGSGEYLVEHLAIGVAKAFSIGLQGGGRLNLQVKALSESQLFSTQKPGTDHQPAGLSASQQTTSAPPPQHTASHPVPASSKPSTSQSIPQPAISARQQPARLPSLQPQATSAGIPQPAPPLMPTQPAPAPPPKRSEPIYVPLQPKPPVAQQQPSVSVPSQHMSSSGFPRPIPPSVPQHVLGPAAPCHSGAPPMPPQNANSSAGRPVYTNLTSYAPGPATSPPNTASFPLPTPSIGLSMHMPISGSAPVAPGTAYPAPLQWNGHYLPNTAPPSRPLSSSEASSIFAAHTSYTAPPAMKQPTSWLPSSSVAWPVVTQQTAPSTTSPQWSMPSTSTWPSGVPHAWNTTPSSTVAWPTAPSVVTYSYVN